MDTKTFDFMCNFEKCNDVHVTTAGNGHHYHCMLDKGHIGDHVYAIGGDRVYWINAGLRESLRDSKLDDRAFYKSIEDRIRMTVRARAEAQENYIASYLHQTGLDVRDIVLVEQKSPDGLRTEWYCEPKKK